MNLKVIADQLEVDQIMVQVNLDQIQKMGANLEMKKIADQRVDLIQLEVSHPVMKMNRKADPVEKDVPRIRLSNVHGVDGMRTRVARENNHLSSRSTMAS